MKCFRVRFAVRQMMIAVAVVTTLTTAGLGATPEVRRRWNDCQIATNRQALLAQMHARFAATNATINATSRQYLALCMSLLPLLPAHSLKETAEHVGRR